MTLRELAMTTEQIDGIGSAVLNFDLLPDSAFVSIGTLASLLGVSDATIRRRIAEGSLPAPQSVLGMQRYQVGVVRNTILKAFDFISLDDPNGGFDKEVAHV